jgi:hypothetical protein
MRDSTWPAAPRPFPDEAFGGWFGRVAGRYGITVDELGTAAGIKLDLNPGGSGWLATNAPAKKSMQELAGLCRLAPEEVDGLCKPALVGSGWLVYCYHCLVLNPCDVFSPYWRQAWIGSSLPPCRQHEQWVGYVSRADMRKRRNLPRLLKMLERRWQLIRREHRLRNS